MTINGSQINGGNVGTKGNGKNGAEKKQINKDFAGGINQKQLKWVLTNKDSTMRKSRDIIG